MNMLRRLLCRHEYRFVCNIYGDEINWVGGMRSIWQCWKCGKYRFSQHLYCGGDDERYR